jgi:hypothetical protein
VKRYCDDVAGCEEARRRVRLWRLGRGIGFEWARDNAIRRIDTDDFETWWEAMVEAPKAKRDEVLGKIERLAAERLGSSRAR